MDFASALEQLEKTADAAANGGRGRGEGGGRHSHRGGGGGYRHDNYRGGGDRDNYRGGGDRDQYRGGGGDHYRSHDRDHYRGGGGGRRRNRPEYNSSHSSRDGDRDYARRPAQRARMGDYHHHRGRGSPDRRGRGPPLPQQQQQQRGRLDEMIRYGYRVDPYRPPAALPADLGTRPFHICLLAICIDGLPYEHIWRAWATTTAPASNCVVSLLVHAKYPHDVTSESLQPHLITKPPRMGRGNSFADPEYLSHAPAWGSVQITRAMVDLLRIAHPMGTTDNPDHLKQEEDARFSSRRFWLNVNGNDPSQTVPPVDKFLFISETCLPVQTLPEFEKAFFGPPELYQTKTAAVAATESDGDHKTAAAAGVQRPDANTPLPWEVSWVNAKNRNSPDTPRNKYESDQFAMVHRMIHGHYRWKADQWCALSRPHATALLNIDGHYVKSYNDQLWKTCFWNVNASDEMYIPCALAVLQILVSETPPSNNPNNPASTAVPVPPLQLQQVQKQPVTFTDWSEGMRNPATFSQGVTDLAKIALRARQQGSLVARKFATQASPEAPVTGRISADEWSTTLQQVTERQQVLAEQQARQEAEEEKARQEAAEAAAAAEKARQEEEEEATAAAPEDGNGEKKEGDDDAAVVEEKPPNDATGDAPATTNEDGDQPADDGKTNP